MARKTRKQPPFEDQLARLEEITVLLENGTIPLADLLLLFEEGIQLLEQCREFLTNAEQKVIEIQAKNPAHGSLPDSLNENSDNGDIGLQF